MFVVYGGSLVAEDAISGLVLCLNQVFDDVLVVAWLCRHSDCGCRQALLLPVNFLARLRR
jgi:hypothetical protein